MKSILWIVCLNYMSFLSSWSWTWWLKIKCFYLTCSRMPMFIPTILSFRSFELILRTHIVCIMLSTCCNGLKRHIIPWFIKKFTTIYEVLISKYTFSFFEPLRPGSIPIRSWYVYSKWTILWEDRIVHKLNRNKINNCVIVFKPLLWY